MVHLSELSPNVNSLDIAVKLVLKTCPKTRYSPHSPLRSGHFVLISHFFSPLHFLISPSSLLNDFFSQIFSSFHFRVGPSLLDSVSSESQSHHHSTFLVCFRCVTLCHQICFVLLRDVCEIRPLASCTNMYFSITFLILPSPLLDAHAFKD